MNEWLRLLIICLILIDAILIAWQINKGITHLLQERAKK